MGRPKKIKEIKNLQYQQLKPSFVDLNKKEEAKEEIKEDLKEKKKRGRKKKEILNEEKKEQLKEQKKERKKKEKTTETLEAELKNLRNDLRSQSDFVYRSTKPNIEDSKRNKETKIKDSYCYGMVGAYDEAINKIEEISREKTEEDLEKTLAFLKGRMQGFAEVVRKIEKIKEG